LGPLPRLSVEFNIKYYRGFVKEFSPAPRLPPGGLAVLIFQGDLPIIAKGHRKELEMKITSRLQNDILIFDIDGEIKRSPDITDITLHQLVKEQLDAGRRKMNFAQVEFIDSYGVGEILASHISVSNIGGKLKLVRLSKKLFLIFQVTGLIRVLHIADDEDTALKDFN
jgi:stage II sporulation protein AA (anti-sigma F factor antagonist)